MKKVAYVLMSALVALGSAACGGGGNENKPEQKDPTNTDSGYVAPEQNNAEKIEFMEECKPAKKNPCKDGLSCEELPDGKNYCVKECDEDTQCPEGFLCGDDFNLYSGLCVYQNSYYGMSGIGDFLACPRDSVSTTMEVGYYASSFFSDAGENDVIYNVGFCAPKCDVTDKSATACPAIDLDEDEDLFGLDGVAVTCLARGKDKSAICSIPVDDLTICEDGLLRCEGIYGRKEAKYNNGYLANLNDGPTICSYNLLWKVNGSMDEDGLYEGFEKYPMDGLIGNCLTLCDDNADCACSDPNDPACKNLKSNEFRGCYVMEADDDSSDQIYNICQAFAKCNTAADCEELDGYVAVCVDPSTLKEEYKGKNYVMKSITEKFCDYEQATKK